MTIRLSPRVVEHFKSQGKGWQTSVNEALPEYVNSVGMPANENRR